VCVCVCVCVCHVDSRALAVVDLAPHEDASTSNGVCMCACSFGLV
jgi:hypothetical protein